MEVKVEQSSALAYVLCLYKLYWSHISDQNWGLLGGGQLPEGSKACCHQHYKSSASFSQFSG